MILIKPGPLGKQGIKGERGERGKRGMKGHRYSLIFKLLITCH